MISHPSTNLRIYARSVLAALATATALFWTACGSGTSSPDTSAVVTVDTSVRFQTMTGWEATSQAGQEFAGFPGWRNALFDQAVEGLGINRLRLETRPGSEGATDYYLQQSGGDAVNIRCARLLTINDNDNPRVINPAGFHFSELDSNIVNVVVPMRSRLAARGEKLYLNLNYVAFLRQCPPPVYVHGEPAEYAEFMLAVFLHMRDGYGFVPDAVEIILEPDNSGPPWNGTLIGKAIVATGARLAEAGFHPEFVAPSTTDLGNALDFVDEMYRVPGAIPLVRELAFHRYRGVTDARLADFATRAESRGARTAMLEHIGSDVDDLYEDLTVGRVSAWQQYTLAYPADDNGGHYFTITDGRPIMGSRTRYLRQYFHYVRMGATRVEAKSDSPGVRPIAFLNVDGRLVVVIHVSERRSIKLRGLAPGTYGVSATTAQQTGTELGDRVSGADGTLSLTAPAAGVLTAYRK